MSTNGSESSSSVCDIVVGSGKTKSVVQGYRIQDSITREYHQVALVYLLLFHHLVLALH